MGPNAADDPSLDGSERLVAREGILHSTVGDEEVLLDPNSEVYYGLNPVGTYLWDQLQDPRSVGELIERTADEFDVSRSECRDDVREFLADLLESDLVERR